MNAQPQPTLIHLGLLVFQIGDLVNTILLVVAIVALGLTWWQTKKGTKSQQAEVFKEMFLSAFSDRDMLDALLVVELADDDADAFKINDDGSAKIRFKKSR